MELPSLTDLLFLLGVMVCASTAVWLFAYFFGPAPIPKEPEDGFWLWSTPSITLIVITLVADALSLLICPSMPLWILGLITGFMLVVNYMSCRLS